jgi:hypothetical protein
MDSNETSPTSMKNAGDTHIDYAGYAKFAPKGTVAPKYMGTIVDQYDMSAMGRAQVLRVRVLMRFICFK